MSKKIFIISEHHNPQALKEILSAGMDGQTPVEMALEPEARGTRSVTEVLNMIVANSGLIISLIGSTLMAWKLYVDQQKNRIEVEKLKLEERRQQLSEEQFQFEKKKWEKAQAELERATPRTISVLQEVGDDIVAPLDLSSVEKTKVELKEKLKLTRPDNIKGIVFE